jgi:hypothetical protein
MKKKQPEKSLGAFLNMNIDIMLKVLPRWIIGPTLSRQFELCSMKCHGCRYPAQATIEIILQ